jgi:tetratricopeptide (TPR) repeat protein
MTMNELQIARLLDQARSFVREEKPLHAMQVYRRLLAAAPDCVPAYRELSSLYGEMGRDAAAIGLLRRAELVLPGNEEVVFLLGMRHLQAEDFDRAITCFKRIAGRKLPQVHFQLAVAYFYKGNLKAAEEQFRMTLQYDPHFPRINESLGELLLQRNAFTDAVHFLKKGIAADPYSAVNHFLLGLAYGRLHDWKKAHEEFIVTVDMDPLEPQHWQLCGESLIHLKRYEEAEPYLRKALGLAPSSVDAMLALCKVLTVKGDLAGAQAIRAAAFSLDPATARAGEIRWKLRQAAQQQSR